MHTSFAKLLEIFVLCTFFWPSCVSHIFWYESSLASHINFYLSEEISFVFKKNLILLLFVIFINIESVETKEFIDIFV